MSIKLFSRYYIIVALFGVIGVCVGCGESESTVVAPIPEAAAIAQEERDPIPETIEAFAQSLQNQLISNVVEEEALRQMAKTVKESKATKHDPFHYRSILRRIYGEPSKSKLLFFRGAQLSEVGQSTLDSLKEMHLHGLDSKKMYHTQRLDKSLDKLLEFTLFEDELFELSETDRSRAEGLLRAGVVRHDDLDVSVKLFDAMVKNPSAPMLKAKKQAQRRAAKIAPIVASVELDLTDAVSKFAWDMHYRNPAWFNLENFKNQLADEQKKILTDNLRKEITDRLPKEDIPFFMQDLVPKHDQYHKLLPVLAKYRKIVEDGGWDKLSATDLKPGRRHRTVKKLKKRLAVEGYYPPAGLPAPDELTDLFDDDLAAAITEYQRTHLIRVTGTPDRWFWHELRIPAKERLKLIEITIDRWRESRIGDDDHFLLVNVPDYHAEVWKDGERQMRFKIIAGNTEMGCDLNKKRWIRINATPLQSGEIATIVLNPWWSIPDRIRREEILPAIAKNPNYFEESGLQCLKHSGDECVKVRRSPGGKNPLGRVKFIFPNIHNTFLHDTPHQKFFDAPRRFFSHGCMRVHDPLNLAEYILKADGNWDKSRFDRLLERGHEYTYTLDKPFSIHVEYYTTRVGDDGTVFFLHDVYKHDRYKRRGQKFEPRRCKNDELANAMRPGSGSL